MYVIGSLTYYNVIHVMAVKASKLKVLLLSHIFECNLAYKKTKRQNNTYTHIYIATNREHPDKDVAWS